MKIVYLILLSVGLLIFTIAIVLLMRTRNFLKSAYTADAVVTELVLSDSNDGDTWAPIFHFTTNKGQEVNYRYGISSSPPGWKVGDHEKVLYDPYNPEDAKVITYFGLFAPTIILLAIAMPLLIIGGGYYVAMPYLRSLSTI